MGTVSDITNKVTDLDPAAFLPGSLASNASGQSINISGQATIVGDVDAVGSAQLGTSVNVTGKVSPNGSVQNLPDITIENYDPVGKAGVQNLMAAAYSDPKTYTGYVRRQGDLKLGAGVSLNQAVLYVDGDL